MLKALIVVVVCFMLSACGPSCEERGGHTVFAYMMPIVGAKGMITYVPIFECVGDKQP